MRNAAYVRGGEDVLPHAYETDRLTGYSEQTACFLTGRVPWADMEGKCLSTLVVGTSRVLDFSYTPCARLHACPTKRRAAPLNHNLNMM